MRITCPNCTSHFELPTELLGRKGRALKCASCGHSWYQTAQVETLDLAAIMGGEYAAPTPPPPSPRKRKRPPSSAPLWAGKRPPRPIPPSVLKRPRRSRRPSS